MEMALRTYRASLSVANYEGSTITQYMKEIEFLCEYLETHFQIQEPQLTEVTAAMLIEYTGSLRERGLVASSINRTQSILRNFFAFLKDAGEMKQNPCDALRPIREKVTREEAIAHERTVLTGQEVDDLLYYVANGKRRNKKRDLAILALILASGLRASEVCSLNVEQYNEIVSGQLYCVRKGGNWREVAVGAFAAAPLEDYLVSRTRLQPDSPLFVSTHGIRLTRVTLWRSLAAKQKDIDIKTGVHILRHTVLTAIKEDTDIVVARDVGGHAKLETTGGYVRTRCDARVQALNNTPLAALFEKRERKIS